MKRTLVTRGMKEDMDNELVASDASAEHCDTKDKLGKCKLLWSKQKKV